METAGGYTAGREAGTAHVRRTVSATGPAHVCRRRRAMPKPPRTASPSTFAGNSHPFFTSDEKADGYCGIKCDVMARNNGSWYKFYAAKGQSDKDELRQNSPI